MDERAIIDAIARDLNISAAMLHPRPAAGGDINAAFTLHGTRHTWFVKVNDDTRLDMFEAEADGLADLARCRELRVPTPLAWGTAGGHSYLVLEHIELRPLSGPAQAAFGRGLAALHQHRGPAFGWHRDNTLGTTPQPNGWMQDWTDFWRTRRLGHQLALAADNGHTQLREPGEALLARLDTLLEGHAPQPVLLHGDLWVGNAAADAHGRPVIYDPAVYYGDRETDLAMMRLFGGFGETCLGAYEAELPPAPGDREIRCQLYQLYHLLNHCNLFGGGYVRQSYARIKNLI